MVLQCCHCKTSGPLRCRHLLQVGLASPTLVCFRALQRRHSVRQGAPPPPGPRAGPDRGAARAPALRPLAPKPRAARQRYMYVRYMYYATVYVRTVSAKLWRVRSRLCRSHILQVNTRWKALEELYTMRSFALL